MSSRHTSAWVFPSLKDLPDGEDLIAIGADLEPETLLSAYEAGYFPMPLGRRRLGWFSPDPRGVLHIPDIRISRSLRRSLRRYSVTINQAFDEVVRACADPSRPHGWIDRRIIDGYVRLHHLGHAHSIEVWDDYGLAGGLYGVSVGGLFAGESMFHRRTDASKAALVHLTEQWSQHPDAIIDVQWQTPHLASLGITEVPRTQYATLLAAALEIATPSPFSSLNKIDELDEPPGD